MRFKLVDTQNGLTVFDAMAGETYKSRHNVAVETEEVFFRPGVRENPWISKARPFRVLELGFGLGSNFHHLAEKNLDLELVSIDRDLGGARFLLEHEENKDLREILSKKIFLKEKFKARLLEEDFFTALPKLKEKGEIFHCVYFDPFSPKANPDAWTEHLFRLSAALLAPEGRLVTYSVSRAAKDFAQAAGFQVMKHNLPVELQKRSALLAILPAEPL